MKINKVLVVRLSSIGDIVLTSPVVRWLKMQCGAEIHFLTKAAFATLVIQNPYVDKTILLEKGRENEAIDALRSENYDLVIDLHKSLKTKIISLKLGIKTISFDKLNVKKWIYVNFKRDLLPDIHLVDRYLQALTSLKITDDGEGLDFFIEESTKVELDLTLNYDVLVLGAAHATKRIPLDLSTKIIERSVKKIVLLGGKDVVAEAESLGQKLNVINLVGKTNLNQSALVMKNAQKIITGDTGMMHIAAALKKPLLVYWGNTTPKFGMYPYYGKNHPIDWVSKEVHISCRPCSKIGYKACPKGHFNCMMLQDVS